MQFFFLLTVSKILQCYFWKKHSISSQSQTWTEEVSGRFLLFLSYEEMHLSANFDRRSKIKYKKTKKTKNYFPGRIIFECCLSLRFDGLLYLLQNTLKLIGRFFSTPLLSHSLYSAHCRGGICNTLFHVFQHVNYPFSSKRGERYTHRKNTVFRRDYLYSGDSAVSPYFSWNWEAFCSSTLKVCQFDEYGFIHTCEGFLTQKWPKKI